MNLLKPFIRMYVHFNNQVQSLLAKESEMDKAM